jgi:hypothetical protein
MKYLELYIKSLNKKQAQNTVPVPFKVFSLPGLKTAKHLAAEEIIRCKREYNLVLRGYQKNKRAVSSLKGKRKTDMNKQLKSTKQHLDSLWIKLGDPDPSKRAMGFEEVRDAK